MELLTPKELKSVYNAILKKLGDDHNAYVEIISAFNDGVKIRAVKAVRSACGVGLREAKTFIDQYFIHNYDPINGVWINEKVIRLEEFMADVNRSSNSKSKKKRKKRLNTFQGIDIRQVNNESLKQLYKAVKKELKKRGELK